MTCEPEWSSVDHVSVSLQEVKNQDLWLCFFSLEVPHVSFWKVVCCPRIMTKRAGIMMVKKA